MKIGGGVRSGRTGDFHPVIHFSARLDEMDFLSSRDLVEEDATTHVLIKEVVKKHFTQPELPKHLTLQYDRFFRLESESHLSPVRKHDELSFVGELGLPEIPPMVRQSFVTRQLEDVCLL